MGQQCCKLARLPIQPHQLTRRTLQLQLESLAKLVWLKIFWIAYGTAQRLASRSVPLLTAISTGLYNHRSAQCITS